VSLSIDKTSFDCNSPLSQTVTLTVRDQNNNTSTCTSTVNLSKDITPTALCKTVTVQLDASGQGRITPNLVDDGSSVACGSANLSLDKDLFTCIDLGNSTTTLTVTDANNKSSSCQTSILVEDKVLPTVNCQDLTIQLDDTGKAFALSLLVGSNSTDNCGLASFRLNKGAFDCSNIGPNTVELTVRDVSGNSAKCNAVITVEDKKTPQAFCQDVSIQLDANGSASTTAASINKGSSDNCGISTISLDKTDFDCNDLGANTVQLTVTDVNGLKASCQATVTVEDKIAPTAVCRNVSVSLNLTGQAFLPASEIASSSVDNCFLGSLSSNKNTFTCDDLGLNQVQVTVKDESGNPAVCSATVTVEKEQDLEGVFSTQSIGSTSGGARYDPCDLRYYINSIQTASYNSKVGYGEFTYVILNGDFTFTADLKSLSSNGIGGLMVRESSNANALMTWVGKHGYSMTGGVKLNAGDRVMRQGRGRGSRTSVINVTRSGNVIIFTQGRTTLLRVRMAMGTSMQVGMFLSSTNSTQAKASFANVSYSTTNNTSAIQLSNSNMSPNGEAGSGFSSEGRESELSPLRGLGGGKPNTLTLKTWPNPSQDFVNLDVDAFIGNAAILNVYDLSGKLMLRENLGMIYHQQHVQDVQSLPEGIYIISLESAGQVAKSKVVVTK
ncbi:MAG: T9SS type A sorting domain-containing protein, partial [Bacteroidota bacterium]